MDLGLEGRTAIVTGASAGLGLAVAEMLAAEGANVAMLGRRRDLLQGHADRIGALAVQGDLTIPAHLDRLVEETLDAFGRIDVLVLNGGGPPAGTALELTVEALEDAVGLLLTPFVGLVGRVVPHMRTLGAGRILALESVAVKEPIAGLALSNAVRPGVIGWLKTLSRELAPEGITVNAIAPGRIATDRLRQLYGADGPPPEVLAQIPAGRVGTPAEIAAVACFLVSDQASYVTGTVVPVDGGVLRGLA